MVTAVVGRGGKSAAAAPEPTIGAATTRLLVEGRLSLHRGGDDRLKDLGGRDRDR